MDEWARIRNPAVLPFTVSVRRVRVKVRRRVRCSGLDTLSLPYP